MFSYKLAYQTIPLLDSHAKYYTLIEQEIKYHKATFIFPKIPNC